MTVYARGSVYWYEFQFRNHRIRESSFSRNKLVAERIERERRRSLELGTGGIEEVRKPLMFSRVANEWLETNPHWSKSTHSIADQVLRRLMPAFGKMLVNDIKPQHIATYQRMRQKEEAAGRTINMEVSAMRQILRAQGRWAHFDGKVKMLRENQEIGRALTADEVHRLDAAARRSRSRSLPVAITMLRYTGMRVSELRTMRWRQVDFLGRTVKVGKAKTKSSEGRLIPLNEGAFNTLLEWRALFDDPLPEHYIFPSERYGFAGDGAHKTGKVSVYDIDPSRPIGSWKVAWTACRKTAGVTCRLHDFRHSFVSALAEAQVADSTLMALTGHMSKRMIEHYSHVRNQAKREAVAVFDSGNPLA
jgi:integrase